MRKAGGCCFCLVFLILWGFGPALLLADVLESLNFEDNEKEIVTFCPPAPCHCYQKILTCHILQKDVWEKESIPADSSVARVFLQRVPALAKRNAITLFTVLDFRGNNISTIWKDNWLYYPDAEYLNLKYNRLTQLIPGSFVGLKNLKYLFLAHNRIEFAASFIFQATPQIQLIDLSNNNLYQVQKNLFKAAHGFLFLKILDLSKNSIVTIESTAFGQLSSLQFLNISSNMLTRAGEKSFQNLTSVLYLDVRDTLVSLDLLRIILQNTTNVVELFVSEKIKCCLCKFPVHQLLFEGRALHLNCAGTHCNITLSGCYEEINMDFMVPNKTKAITPTPHQTTKKSNVKKSDTASLNKKKTASNSARSGVASTMMPATQHIRMMNFKRFLQHSSTAHTLVIKSNSKSNQKLNDAHLLLNQTVNIVHIPKNDTPIKIAESIIDVPVKVPENFKNELLILNEDLHTKKNSPTKTNFTYKYSIKKIHKQGSRKHDIKVNQNMTAGTVVPLKIIAKLKKLLEDIENNYLK
ncbi:leucine-rich repeat-containing protein 37A3-like [Latimeria chalumnae]|uniref:leucine-rich repeat-containing protein 37A3-like n=1 Tax=Latimeria chalumnae TaxID=7897 RepID=UPI00313E5FED